MTDSDSNNGGPIGGNSKSGRRLAAREKARQSRLRQRRRARTGRWAIQGGIALVIIAAAVAVVLVITNIDHPAGQGPANMASDGITIGKGFTAETSDARPASQEPTATTTTAASDRVSIVVYLDYLCPICGSFEKTNNTYIKGLVESGAATVEYHPIAILTNYSLGTKYSVRAANAAACVANYSPDSYFDFNTAMFDKQPEEQTAGLTDTQLVSLIKGVDGITHTSEISSCVKKQRFASWVTSATQRATTGPLSGTSVAKVTGTPTILVNGQQYKYTTPFTTDEFSNFVVTAAGNTYTGDATATSTPTPGPSGSPTPTATATPTK